MVANSGILSSLSTTVSTQLVDKTDSPHSGLFKGLHSMTQGNYALKDGSTLGFAHTFTTSGANIQVALTAGKGFSNGQYIAVDALSATTVNKPSSGALYHWVAFADDGDGTGTISIVAGTSDGVVPDLTVTLTPISLIKVQSTDTHSTVAFQTFTTSKTENQLSIGYTNSNAYTETMSIEGSATRTLFKNKIADADIRFVLADNTAAEKFEIYSDDDSDGDEGDTAVFSVDGLGATSVVGTLNLGSVVNAGTDTDKFLVLDGSGNVDFRTGSEVASDIGASGATALNELSDVSYSSGDLTITSLDKIVYANGGNAELSVAATTSTTAGRDLTIEAGSTSTGSNNIDGGDLILKSGGGDGTGTSMIAFHTKVSGTDTAAERMRIHTDGNVGIGIATPSAPLHILSGGSGDHLLIEGTLASSTTSAPNLVLFRDADSVAADIDSNDLIGQIVFRGENDGANNSNVPQEVNYATIEAGMDDTADDSEDGHMTFNLIEAGTLTEFMRLRAATRDVVINDQHDDIDFRVEGDTDSNLLFCDASADKVGISTNAPSNILQVNVTGADGLDGIQIVREDSSTSSGDILGGIGFDSTDGNVPSSITEASAFIAAYATEDHTTTDKGGELKMGLSFINDDDDTTSVVLSRIGYPTSTNATVYAGAFSRAAVATVAAATYSPAIADSGTVIIMTNASSIVTLPDVGATDVGVQFTIINNSGGTLSGKIVSADTTNTRFNGAGSYAAVNIEDDQVKTFLCWGADNWQVIG